MTVAVAVVVPVDAGVVCVLAAVVVAPVLVDVVAVNAVVISLFI